MAVVTTAMTMRNSSQQPSGFGEGSNVKVLGATTEVVGSESTTSTFTIGQIPSSARLLGSSRMQCDNIGAATAALKVGLFGTASDDDCITASLDIATATTGFGLQLLDDHAKAGKRLWEIFGATSDPKELYTVKATLITAAIDAAGTLTFECFFTLE